MTDTNDVTLDFLKSHRLGIFATGKRDGSPQQALISYNFDGDDIVVGTGWDSAKVKNLRRQPRASISIVDGPKVVVVYGEATIVRGDEADSIREARLQPPRQPGQPPRARPQGGERVVIRLVPDRIIANRLDD
jgi:PPOX class probable F420-dependent enzyme